MAERPQHYIGMWLDGTQAEVDDYQADYLQGEVGEFREKWDKLNEGDDPREVILELADVMYCAIGLIHLLGGDADEALLEKAGINFVKYPPDTIQELMSEGMSRADAMAYMKTLWAMNNPTPEE